jgi:hypothetical protein
MNAVKTVLGSIVFVGLTLIILALSSNTEAHTPPGGTSDSGLFYNPERDGEGINLIRNGDHVVFYFYTYEPHETCWNIEIPEGGLVTEANCNEQRWFLSGGDKIDDGIIEGWLYTGLGTGYPKCLPNPEDPFLTVCGEAHIVGRYIMARNLTGWRMVVVRVGDILDKEDPLFNQVFDFNTPLFMATD